MKKVTGIGGIFFKSRDPKNLKKWYGDHLGIAADDSGATFQWREENDPKEFGHTIWSPFPHDTKYFDPGTSSFMINYRVADLDGLLASLRAEGVEVDEKVESYEYGRFAWLTDPEGNRIELWEPTPPSKEDNP